MTDNKQYLDIDLEFLDKNFKKRSQLTHNKTRKNTHTSKLQLSKSQIKKYLIIGGIIIFFSWVIFSEDNSNTNNISSYTAPSAKQTSSNDDAYIIGEYRCSKYNYDRAVELDPLETKQQLDVVRSALKHKSNELDHLKNEIDNSYVSEYSSQYEIDQYNKTVNEYNSKFTSYKQDEENFNSRIDRYNVQVEIHNNYLKNHCTLNR